MDRSSPQLSWLQPARPPSTPKSDGQSEVGPQAREILSMTLKRCRHHSCSTQYGLEQSTGSYHVTRRAIFVILVYLPILRVFFGKYTNLMGRGTMIAPTWFQNLRISDHASLRGRPPAAPFSSTSSSSCSPASLQYLIVATTHHPMMARECVYCSGHRVVNGGR